MHPVGIRPPGLVEEEAGHLLDEVALTRQHVDPVVVPALEPVNRAGGAVAEYTVWVRVEKSEPETLAVNEWGVLHGNDAGGGRMPAADRDLVLDLAVGPAQCVQLVAPYDPLLILGDLA